MQHDEQVDQQFGATAAAYLTSQVHAQGADLRRLAMQAQGHPNLHVLDLGCGAGHLSFAVAPHVASVTAVDLSGDMLAVVRDAAEARGLRNLSTRQARAEQLPFGDASFDWVCTRFSVHHWGHPAQALREMRRVLKPGGRIVVIDVIAPESALCDTHLQIVELLRDASHVRNHSLDDWQRLLSSAGLAMGPTDTWTLPMQFDDWVGRMRTPPDRVAMIRQLLRQAPQEVRDHFAVSPVDDSFRIDVAWIEASPQG